MIKLPTLLWGFSGLSLFLTEVPFIKSSFDTLLKLREVMQFSQFVMMFADTRAEITGDEEQTGFCYGTVESSSFRGR